MARVTAEGAQFLPHDPDAERALLGACLLDADAYYAAREVDVRPEDLWLESHRLIWAALLEVAARGAAIDSLTVGDALANGDLEAIGGHATLLGLMADAVTTVHSAEYAAIIKRCATQRRIIAASADLAQMAQEHQGDVASLCQAALGAFLSAVNVTEPTSHLAGSDDALIRYLEAQDRAAERLAENPDGLIEVPWSHLGRLLGDLLPGFIHTIAAESSVGKTMYMEAIAEHNARRGHRVAFYHLELTHQFMMHRLMCRYAGGQGVSMAQLRRGYRGPEVSAALDAVRRWFPNITYVHCPGWSAERIAADVQRLAARGRCDLAIVDYLQKLALPERRGLNAAMLIGLQAEVLKNAAERLGIPVVLGSQLNRSNRQEHRRPSQEDIRNSGEVAERSNQVVILHRPVKREAQAAGAPTETLEGYVDKNTSGQTGMTKLLHVCGRYLLAEPYDGSAEEVPW